MTYLVSMYFKVSMRHNPAIGFISGYFRLVESYHNSSDRICHRTILNVGFLDNVTADQLNQIQKILTLKADNHSRSLFDFPGSDDPVVASYVDELYRRMVYEKRIDVPEKKSICRSGKEIQRIDINRIGFSSRLPVNTAGVFRVKGCAKPGKGNAGSPLRFLRQCLTTAKFKRGLN